MRARFAPRNKANALVRLQRRLLSVRARATCVPRHGELRHGPPGDIDRVVPVSRRAQ
jgi:hypothetical protein